MGIVYIDEVDKLWGLGVQHAQGTVATVPPQGGFKHPFDFDTTNVLFICGGAFVGLEDLIARRLGRGGFGFQLAETSQVAADGFVLRQVKPEDLEAFGCGVYEPRTRPDLCRAERLSSCPHRALGLTSTVYFVL